MPRNVEIKARVRDPNSLRKKLVALCGEPQVIFQEDIFFNTSAGRLKLRIFSPDRGELIFYQRPDRAGPKTSNYFIAATDTPGDLKNVLEKSLGVRCIVRKTRELFRHDRTRIHLDAVENLGTFLELEVVLQDHESDQNGLDEAQDLMRELHISAADLIQGAYADLLGNANLCSEAANLPKLDM